MLASGWATWLIFGDIPIRQLGLWVGPFMRSDKKYSPYLCVSAVVSLLFSFKCVLSRSVISDSVTAWTVCSLHLCPWGFSRQEYWSGLPFPSPGDLPNPGIKPRSPALQVNSLPSKPPRKPNLSVLVSKAKLIPYMSQVRLSRSSV